MSALVCGKRPAFDDACLSSPGASPPIATPKRQRFRSAHSPSRFLPGLDVPQPPLVSTESAPTSASASASGGWAPAAAAAAAAAAAVAGGARDPAKLALLRAHFPSMTSEELERALLECGHDLDLTIQNLNLLRLASSSDPGGERDRSDFVATESPRSPAAAAAAAAAAAVSTAGHTATAASAALPQPTLTSASQQSGQGPGGGQAVGDAVSAVLSVQWVDAVVQEMMGARDLDDARQRAARVLRTFGVAVLERASSGKDEEVKHLRSQLASMQKENHILKRAVAIQHERHLAHEARGTELNNLKQMLSQYQEQLRKLEVNNYVLSLHLQKAQVDNSMPNRFHPDVF